MTPDDDAAQLRDLEAQRCAAMVAGDLARLRELLHEDLIHVHAKGQADNYESYFATGGFRVEYTRLDRADLVVRVFGDTALMTGRQILEATRKSNGERVRIDSQVMQVWLRQGAAWRQVAFQTTPSEHTVTPAN
jgi:ketosteroid isomerase-like protein